MLGLGVKVVRDPGNQNAFLVAVLFFNVHGKHPLLACVFVDKLLEPAWQSEYCKSLLYPPTSPMGTIMGRALVIDVVPESQTSGVNRTAIVFNDNAIYVLTVMSYVCYSSIRRV